MTRAYLDDTKRPEKRVIDWLAIQPLFLITTWTPGAHGTKQVQLRKHFSPRQHSQASKVVLQRKGLERSHPVVCDYTKTINCFCVNAKRTAQGAASRARTG